MNSRWQFESGRDGFVPGRWRVFWILPQETCELIGTVPKVRTGLETAFGRRVQKRNENRAIAVGFEPI